MMPCNHRSMCTRNALPMGELCAEHQAEFDAEEARELARPPAQLSFAEQLDAEEDAGLDFPPRPRRHRHLYASTAPRVFDQEALMPFELAGERTMTASPQKPFKPRGLLLWGAERLNVEAVLIGRDLQVAVTFSRVPALWFMQAQTFEQLAAARAAGIEPPAWGSWNQLYPGIIARLEFDGDASGVRAVMWGHST